MTEQDPNLQQNGMDSDKYHGEFTISTAHDLVKEVQGLEDRPAEEYFEVLQGAVAAQGHLDMAAAIERVSKTSMGTLLRGSFEPIVTSTRDGKPTSTQSAEQWAREYIAFGLGIMLADLYDLSQGRHHGRRGGKQGTSTIADLQVGSDLDKELFMTYARIFAREPERLDATTPTPDEVTDINLMRITPEDRARGVVTLEGQPDKIVRFQKVTVDSNVPGFNFEMWRHNHRGFIRGNETDYHKLYLEQK